MNIIQVLTEVIRAKIEILRCILIASGLLSIKILIKSKSAKTRNTEIFIDKL